jgi:hypothetical protein
VPLARLQPWAEPRQAFRQLSRGATLRCCSPVAIIVGSLLSTVNEGDVLMSGRVNTLVVVKLAENLLIPFLTSSTGALLAVRDRSAAGSSAGSNR